MRTDFDLLIIGGGMVGASLACALAPTELRIGLLEAVELDAPAQPSYDERTIALAYGSKRIYEGIGIWDRIASQGVAPIERIHISDRGRFGFARLTAADAGLEALGYIVANRVLGVSMYEAIREHEHVQLLCPAIMQKIEFRADAAVISFRRRGRLHRASARLVVAADGANSSVRRAVGIAAHGIDYGQTAVVTTVTPGMPHENTAYERFTSGGPLALLPMADGRCAVVWTARAAEIDAMLAWDDAGFLSRLQERFGERLGRFQNIGRRRAYPLFLTRVREHVRPRLALIGNAAHTVHPVAGQGFNLGLRDVAALAEVLSEGSREQRDVGDIALLRTYADWRRRDNQVIARFTDGLARIFSTSFLPVVLARDAGLIAVDLLAPVKQRLIRITSGVAGRLPRLARGLPLH